MGGNNPEGTCTDLTLPALPPPYNSYTISAYESTSSSAMASEELYLAKALLPKEPCWVTIFLPVLPIVMAGLVITPVPLLHLGSISKTS